MGGGSVDGSDGSGQGYVWCCVRGHIGVLDKGFELCCAQSHCILLRPLGGVSLSKFPKGPLAGKLMGHAAANLRILAQ